MRRHVMPDTRQRAMPFSPARPHKRVALASEMQKRELPMPLLLSPVPVRHSKQAPAAQAAGPPCLPSESSLVAHHPRREPSPDLDTDTDTAILSWFLCDHFEGLLGALTGITGRATSTGTDTAKTGNRSPHSSHHIHSHSSHLPSLSTPKSFKGLQEPTPDPRPDHFGGGEPGSNSLRTDRHVNGPAASSSHQQQQQWIPRTESAVSCATLYCTEYYQVISSTSAGDLLSSALPTIPVQPNHLLVTSVPVLSNSDESDTDCDSDLGVPHPSPVSLAAPTFEMLPKCTSPGILLATPTSESSAVEVVVTAVPACSRRQEREAALALCGTFPELTPREALSHVRAFLLNPLHHSHRISWLPYPLLIRYSGLYSTLGPQPLHIARFGTLAKTFGYAVEEKGVVGRTVQLDRWTSLLEAYWWIKKWEREAGYGL